MEPIITAIATKVASKPILDIYDFIKAQAGLSLDKIKGTAARRRMVEKIASVEKVKTFWQRDKDVALTSFYYPSRVCFDGSEAVVVNGLSKFDKNNNYVIEGTVGQGKSIFLRYLCIQELSNDGSGRIPVFIELRSIAKNEKNGLVDAIYSALDKLGFEINEKLYEYYLSSGKIVLLLDGFDELDESLISGVVNQLECISEKYKYLQIFITSRPGSAIQNCRNFRVCRLAPLTNNDHQKFLIKIGVDADEVEKVMGAINESSSGVIGLLVTPLMLTLLVIVYRSENSIPQEIPEFYERLFQTLLNKHDAAKPGYVRPKKSGLGDRKFRQLFDSFCFSTLQLKYGTALSEDSFNVIFDKAMQYFDGKCESEGFKHDVCKVTCLMQEQGFEYHYIHKSVVEFFAASFIKNRSDLVAEKFYSRLVLRDWRKWAQVLQFLSQIDQYRYIRYYGIPSVLETFKFLDVEDNGQCVAVDFEMLKKIFSTVCISYGALGDNSPDGSIENDNKKYRMASLGPFGLMPYEMEEISNILTNCVFSNVESSVFDDVWALKSRYGDNLECEAGGDKFKRYRVHWSHYIDDELSRGKLILHVNEKIRSLFNKYDIYKSKVEFENQNFREIDII